MRVSAEDITEQIEIDCLVKFWRHDRADKDYKTSPCFNGVYCHVKSCKYSHEMFRGSSLVRCMSCAKGSCKGNALRYADINGRGTVMVCKGFVDQLANRKEPGEVTDTRSVLLRSSSDLNITEPKKRERPAEMICYLMPSKSNKKALVDLVSDADFKGCIKISAPFLMEVVQKMPGEDLIALTPDLEKIPGAMSIVAAKLLAENAKLKAELNKK